MSDEWEDYTQAPPTRPRPADGYTPHTRDERMDLNTIKEGLKRLLPVLKMVAKLTPNKYDDAAVAFLEAILADEAKMAAAVDAAK